MEDHFEQVSDLFSCKLCVCLCVYVLNDKLWASFGCECVSQFMISCSSCSRASPAGTLQHTYVNTHTHVHKHNTQVQEGHHLLPVQEHHWLAKPEIQGAGEGR